jgi:shikimate dehydrogenase
MDKYGLIGKSLSHSFSKSFFEHFFQENKINATFQNFELDNISEVRNVFNQNPIGCCVTIPYKEEIIAFTDELSNEAEEIAAVNVIQFKDNKIIGHNSDAYGFQQSIKPFLTNKHERAIVLGTGGASKAVSYVLKKIGIDVIYISRKPKAKNEFAYSDINENMLKACKLIVNCTPVGTFPNIHDRLIFPSNHLGVDHLVVDLIYNPDKTQLLIDAEFQGATILNGSSMLKHQAIRAWEIWNNSEYF